MNLRASSEPMGEIGVTVRPFARYAELLGEECIELRLRAPATVADAIRALRAGSESARRLPERPLVAVDLQHVLPDRVLTDGDELALLPPLAGG